MQQIGKPLAEVMRKRHVETCAELDSVSCNETNKIVSIFDLLLLAFK